MLHAAAAAAAAAAPAAAAADSWKNKMWAPFPDNPVRPAATKINGSEDWNPRVFFVGVLIIISNVFP